MGAVLRVELENHLLELSDALPSWQLALQNVPDKPCDVGNGLLVRYFAVQSMACDGQVPVRGAVDSVDVGGSAGRLMVWILRVILLRNVIFAILPAAIYVNFHI
mmetsp:Transcript_76938/g.138812  ORF Transcript_76938/g.138812 Transcript_76938/m.138812 type:complete len:104 (+) Transcript_76938:755-1066(+)